MKKHSLIIIVILIIFSCKEKNNKITSTLKKLTDSTYLVSWKLLPKDTFGYIISAKTKEGTFKYLQNSQMNSYVILSKKPIEEVNVSMALSPTADLHVSHVDIDIINIGSGTEIENLSMNNAVCVLNIESNALPNTGVADFIQNYLDLICIDDTTHINFNHYPTQFTNLSAYENAVTTSTLPLPYYVYIDQNHDQNHDLGPQIPAQLISTPGNYFIVMRRPCCTPNSSTPISTGVVSPPAL